MKSSGQRATQAADTHAQMRCCALRLLFERLRNNACIYGLTSAAPVRLHQSRRCFTATFQRDPLAAATAGSRGWAAAWKSNSKCTQARCEFVAARVVQKKHFKITTFFLLYKMTFFGFDVSLASSRSDVHGRMTQATCLTKLVPAAARARVDASEPPFQSQPPCMRNFAHHPFWRTAAESCLCARHAASFT